MNGKYKLLIWTAILLVSVASNFASLIVSKLKEKSIENRYLLLCDRKIDTLYTQWHFESQFEGRDVPKCMYDNDWLDTIKTFTITEAKFFNTRQDIEKWVSDNQRPVWLTKKSAFTEYRVIDLFRCREFTIHYTPIIYPDHKIKWSVK